MLIRVLYVYGILFTCNLYCTEFRLLKVFTHCNVYNFYIGSEMYEYFLRVHVWERSKPDPIVMKALWNAL